VQSLLRQLDQIVQRSIQRAVIVVLCAAMLWDSRSDLAGRNDRLRKVMIDVRVDACQGELDAGD
jgi:hypothetical protein